MKTPNFGKSLIESPNSFKYILRRLQKPTERIPKAKRKRQDGCTTIIVGKSKYYEDIPRFAWSILYVILFTNNPLLLFMEFSRAISDLGFP